MSERDSVALVELAGLIARRMRALREARGWSLTTLGREAGLSKTIVATIESGNGNPSLETLLRLADALGITLGSLIATEQRPGAQAVRLEDAEFVASESGLRSRSLWSDGRDRRVETLELLIEAGVEYRAAPHPPGTEEIVVCLSGSLEVGPEGETVPLQPRDAVHFPADQRHRYRSDTGGVALCLMTFRGSGS